MTARLNAYARDVQLQVDLPQTLDAERPLIATRVWLGDPTLAEIPVELDLDGRVDQRLPTGVYGFRFRGLQSPPADVEDAAIFRWRPPLVGLGLRVTDPNARALRLEQVQGDWREEWAAANGVVSGFAPEGRVRVALRRTQGDGTGWWSLGTWSLGEPDGWPTVIAAPELATLALDVRVGGQRPRERGGEVQLRPVDRPELVAASAKVVPGAPLALTAPVGRYQVVLVGPGTGSVPAGRYVLDPDLALGRDTERTYDARVVPVELRSGLTGGEAPARWFVAPYPGAGPAGEPRPAVAGARIVDEGADGVASLSVFPGRYRGLSLPPGASARAQLLDADLVFEADSSVTATLGRQLRRVDLEVTGPADAVVLTGATWTARVPLTAGRGAISAPAYDYEITFEADDVAPRSWRLRRACSAP